MVACGQMDFGWKNVDVGGVSRVVEKAVVLHTMPMPRSGTWVRVRSDWGTRTDRGWIIVVD